MFLSEMQRVEVSCLWSAGLVEWSLDPGVWRLQASIGKFPGLPAMNEDVLGDISRLSTKLPGYSMALPTVGHF